MEGRQSIPPPDGSGTDSDETQTSDPASRRASLNQLTNGELRKYVYDERREQREREAALRAALREREAALHAALRDEAGAHRAAQEAHRAAEEALRAAAAEERRAAEVRLRAAEERERLALELAASRCCEIM